jgi:hypothetical protein
MSVPFWYYPVLWRMPSSGIWLIISHAHSSRIFLPWRWRRYIPPKHRFTQHLHCATSHKTTFFIVTAENLKSYLSCSSFFLLDKSFFKFCLILLVTATFPIRFLLCYTWLFVLGLLKFAKYLQKLHFCWLLLFILILEISNETLHKLNISFVLVSFLEQV